MPQHLKNEQAQISQDYLKRYQIVKDKPLLFGNEGDYIKDQVIKFARFNGLFGRILYSKYIEGKSTPKICAEIGYGKNSYDAFHRDALIKFFPYSQLPMFCDGTEVTQDAPR